MRLFLLLALAGCTSGDASTCRIESYALPTVSGQTPDDCGSLSSGDGGDGDAAMQRAHDCVLAAISAARPFTLFYDAADPARHVRGGLVGALDGGGKLRLRAYAWVGDTGGGSSDAHPAVTVQSCQSVIATDGCTPAVGRPCLTCSAPGVPSALCRY